MPTIVLLNEKDLLLQVAEGSEAAYKKLFLFYWEQVYSVALIFTKSRTLSQDISQDIFAQIWVKREKLKEVSRFKSYLFIIARNMIIDRLRKEVFSSRNEEALAGYFNAVDSDPAASVELKELGLIIESGIASLPRQQQTALKLSRFAGFRHEEIARQMGISPQSVKSHIVRALSYLKKYVVTHTAQLFFVFYSLY